MCTERLCSSLGIFTSGIPLARVEEGPVGRQAAGVYSRAPRPGRSSEGQRWVLYTLETEGAVYGFLVDNWLSSCTSCWLFSF